MEKRMARKIQMRRGVSALAAACALGAALGVHTQAAAATYTAIPSYVDPLGGRTSLLGINNAGWLTGSLNYPDGSGQGLVRDAGGAYTTFSVDAFTQGRAISETNVVSGYATDGSSSLLTATEFTRAPGGTVTVLQNPDTATDLYGIAQGMNASGAIVGDFATGFGAQRHGYLLDGGVFTELTIPGDPTTSTRARGITDAGDIAGWISPISGITQGFILSGGVYTFFSAPGAVGNTTFEDLNNNGIAVGNYSDAGGFSHAFFLNTNTNVFKELHIAGATSLQAFGINDLGQVIITTDLATGPSNFLYDPNGVPEPGTWAVMVMGFAGLGAMLRRRRALAFA
jgi:hypothetical protein